MRRAARVDGNQSTVVALLRRLGCSVQPLHVVGQGCPDLLIGVAGVNLLGEVKDPAKPLSARRLTIDQEVWHHAWQGQVAVLEVEDDVVTLVERARAARGAAIVEQPSLASQLVRDLVLRKRR